MFFCFFLFVRHSNISGMAERICAKFIGKTCLVPRSDEFECLGQRSKVKVIKDKTWKNAESSPLTMHSSACAVCCKIRAVGAGDWTIASQPGVTG